MLLHSTSSFLRYSPRLFSIPSTSVRAVSTEWRGKRRVKHRHDLQRQEISAFPHSRTEKVRELHRRLADFERARLAAGVEQEEQRELALWKGASEVAERLVNANREAFERVHARREQIRQETKQRTQQAIQEEQNREDQDRAAINAFPFRAEEGSIQEGQEELLEGQEFMKKNDDEDDHRDQGFFISGNMYVDEYTAGTISDLPDEEEELKMNTREVFGAEDAIETIDFQLPGQTTSEPDDGEGSMTEDDIEESSLVDVSTLKSEQKCGGCGANFHCTDDALPGYLSPLTFAVQERQAKRRKWKRNPAASVDPVLCRRCHLIKHHRFLPTVNVCPVDYASMMSKLRGRQEVLIVLVVDVLDLPGSIHRALPHIIGRGKPMIVVANKVDLLPPDAKCGYLKRIKIAVERAIGEAGYRDAFNILHTALVSAKTGYGVEDLITEIHMKWTNIKNNIRDDVYLVGCTNAGKSTLFNTLLSSDLCKVRAVDIVERATTSVWPGTTLSLLKFPVMRPSSYRLELRRRRLLSRRAWMLKENYARKRSLQETGDPQFAVLIDPVESTFKEQEDELQPVAFSAIVSPASDGEQDSDGARSRTWSLDDPIFTKGAWCYDTPGTVNEDQLLDMLTLPELVAVVPRRLVLPRTAILAPGRTLLIGGLARLDIKAAERKRPIYVTVFASDELPLNTLETSEAEDFLKKHLRVPSSSSPRTSPGALVVPSLDRERLAHLPPMESRHFRVEPTEQMKQLIVEKEGNLMGAADVVFSSVGWAVISTHAGTVDVEASVPGARGLAIRSPPILPYAALLRGHRIPGTDFYKVKPVEFPVNTRRLESKKRRYKQSRNTDY